MFSETAFVDNMKKEVNIESICFILMLKLNVFSYFFVLKTVLYTPVKLLVSI